MRKKKRKNLTRDTFSPLYSLVFIFFNPGQDLKTETDFAKLCIFQSDPLLHVVEKKYKKKKYRVWHDVATLLLCSNSIYTSVLGGGTRVTRILAFIFSPSGSGLSRVSIYNIIVHMCVNIGGGYGTRGRRRGGDPGGDARREMGN